MRYSKVSIKPFFEKNVSNMGLEKYEQVLFEGTSHKYQLAALEESGGVRYITGLDPYAPEITVLPKELREAKEKEIKDIVIKVEKTLAGNVIDPEDPHWWNKVKKLKSDNISFWSSQDMSIVLDNDSRTLDIKHNMIDLLKYMAIKAGGYPEIGKNLTDVKSRPKAPKFFLDELEETISLKTEVSKLRNQAGGELDKMFTKNFNRLLYVCKVLDPNSTQYRKSTPPDIMYDNMDKYINGELTEKDKRKTAKHFLEVAELSMEELQTRAMVKDASFYKFIGIKGDGMIYEMETGTALGKNPTEVAEFLKNPLNEDVWKRLNSKVEHYWKQ